MSHWEHVLFSCSIHAWAQHVSHKPHLAARETFHPTTLLKVKARTIVCAFTHLEVPLWHQIFELLGSGLSPVPFLRRLRLFSCLLRFCLGLGLRLGLTSLSPFGWLITIIFLLHLSQPSSCKPGPSACEGTECNMRAFTCSYSWLQTKWPGLPLAHSNTTKPIHEHTIAHHLSCPLLPESSSSVQPPSPQSFGSTLHSCTITRTNSWLHSLLSASHPAGSVIFAEACKNASSS